LPDVAHFLDFIEVHVGDDDFVLVTAAFGDDFARGPQKYEAP
jgi:hypothetical protein